MPIVTTEIVVVWKLGIPPFLRISFKPNFFNAKLVENIFTIIAISQAVSII
jgi:hypothetical protein